MEKIDDQKSEKTKAKFGQNKNVGEAPKVNPNAPKLVAAKKTGKEKDNFRGIIRIVGKDMPGQTTVKNALRKVPGIGHNLSMSLTRIVLTKSDFKADELVGNLTDEQLRTFEDIIKNPATHGVPTFLLNRPIDPESGKPMHRVMADLKFSVKNDIDKQVDIHSYRGWRHQMGQKVRGQRTRSTGRSGMTVGVMKKSLAKAAAPGPTGDKKDAKK
ncbi:30S ribosomal protein S13 [Candidatus Micrarchaeota archaeon]|nr:30S ribosomal protein S13 [Candidatus Micrarchaeota archaeon]